MNASEIIQSARRILAEQYFEEAQEVEANGFNQPLALDIAASLERADFPLRLQLDSGTNIKSSEEVIHYAFGKLPYTGLQAKLYCGEVYLSYGEAYGCKNEVFISLMGIIRRLSREAANN